MRAIAKHSRGFSLVEIIVSIVCFGILMTLITGVFAPQLIRGTDPLFSMRAAELGQSYLEEILGKRYDENSPFGNAQRCNALAVPPQTFIACSGTMGVEAGESTTGITNTFDDVDDYNGLDSPPRNQNGNVRDGYANFNVNIVVTDATGEFGLPANNAKRIDVTITDPSGAQYVFSAYKANF